MSEQAAFQRFGRAKIDPATVHFDDDTVAEDIDLAKEKVIVDGERLTDVVPVRCFPIRALISSAMIDTPQCTAGELSHSETTSMSSSLTAS